MERFFLLDTVRHISSYRNSAVNNMVCMFNFLGREGKLTLVAVMLIFSSNAEAHRLTTARQC